MQVKQAKVDRETVLLHPSQLHNVKREIVKELVKKLRKWDDRLKGIITKIQHVRILNEGVAQLMDDSAYLHYQVKYQLEYLPMPEIGERIIANLVNV